MNKRIAIARYNIKRALDKELKNLGNPHVWSELIRKVLQNKLRVSQSQKMPTLSLILEKFESIPALDLGEGYRQVIKADATVGLSPSNNYWYKGEARTLHYAAHERLLKALLAKNEEVAKAMFQDESQIKSKPFQIALDLPMPEKKRPIRPPLRVEQ